MSWGVERGRGREIPVDLRQALGARLLRASQLPHQTFIEIAQLLLVRPLGIFVLFLQLLDLCQRLGQIRPHQVNLVLYAFVFCPQQKCQQRK